MTEELEVPDGFRLPREMKEQGAQLDWRWVNEVWEGTRIDGRFYININPKYPHSYNNLGKCFHYLLDKKNSLLNFNKALDLNANFFDAINYIANYYNENMHAVVPDILHQI